MSWLGSWGGATNIIDSQNIMNFTADYWNFSGICRILRTHGLKDYSEPAPIQSTIELVQTYWSLILLFHPSQFEKWCKLGKHCCNKTPSPKKENRGVKFSRYQKFCQVWIKTLILLWSPIKVVSSWMLKTLILLSRPIKALPSWMLKTLILLLKTDNKRIWKEFLLKSSMTGQKLWRNLVTRFWKK
jgi:hypothetical protein